MAQKPKPVQISTYVDPRIKKQVEEIAEKENRSLSIIIAMIIQEFLQRGGSFAKS